MIRRVVAIGGPPGSGKSTAGRLVAHELGLEFRSTGEEFRRQGTARGMDVVAFNRYAESHPEIDRDLDRAMLDAAQPGRLLDGRIVGILCRRKGVPVYTVDVTASEAERVRRIAGRDGQSLEEARQRMRLREQSERERFRREYDIHLDREEPDLRVDATEPPPETIAATILGFLRTRESGDPR